MSGEDLPQKTAFDTLLERMKKDVVELEERSAAAPAESRAPRLQGILDAAIREARSKGDTIRSNIADGAEALREEMRAHPGASVSAAFAAGYMVGKSIAGRTKR
jgi:hypothetical protein